LLFGKLDLEVHMRELTRQSGLTLGSVQEELKKLEAAELLTSRRDGNRLYFRANQNHPIFPELHSLVTKTDALPEILAADLSSLTGIQMAFIFGSVAAGSATSLSDIDLMILGTVTLRQMAPILRQSSQKLCREINPHVLSPAEWAARLQRGDVFCARVAAEPKLFLKGGADELGRLG
jgi:predicted nucleotidyltransferase